MAAQRDPRQELLALADELLAQATEVREQWDQLHRALREPGSPEPRQQQEPATRRREEQRTTPAPDPRRLVAVEMMLAGRKRAEVEAHLTREFGAEAAQEVLAEVYAD